MAAAKPLSRAMQRRGISKTVWFLRDAQGVLARRLERLRRSRRLLGRSTLRAGLFGERRLYVWLSTQSKSLCQVRAARRIGRGDDRIVALEIERGSIAFRRQLVRRL